MTQPQKNSALALAIVAGLISLPLTWVTIRGATFQGGPGGMFGSAFGEMTVVATGFNGHVTVLFKMPIWFIVGVAVVANGLQLMRHSEMFAIPRFAEWLTALAALGWIAIAILIALLSDQVSLGIGSLLGLASAVIPVVCLIGPASRGASPRG